MKIIKGSRRHRIVIAFDGEPYLVLLCAIVLLCFLVLVINGIGLLGKRPPQSSIQDYKQPAEVKGSGDHKLGVETFSGPDFSANNANTPNSKPKHDEEDLAKFEKRLSTLRDLDAQEGMWRVAYALTIATFFQTFLIVVSLWMLRKTVVSTDSTLAISRDMLKESREVTRQASLATEAADRTAQAAETSERAFLFVEFDTVDTHGMNPGLFVDVLIKVVNYGRTPARNVTIKYSEYLGEAGYDSVWRQHMAIGPECPILIPIGSKDKSQLENLAAIGTPYHVYVSVEYSTVFNPDEMKEIDATYMFIRRTDIGDGITPLEWQPREGKYRIGNE